MTLAIGTQAPEFDVVGHQAGAERRLRLSDFRGKQIVVLYFYPRDFTPVCTQEACGFRDAYDELMSRDTEVIGVSVDDGGSHDRFATMHHVPFPLVADPDRKLARAYGATSLVRNLLGTTTRVTYVIDKAGKITAMFQSELFASQHVEGVKQAIAQLAG
jgi:peroxiredoxin Q/BCP